MRLFGIGYEAEQPPEDTKNPHPTVWNEDCLSLSLCFSWQFSGAMDSNPLRCPPHILP